MKKNTFFTTVLSYLFIPIVIAIFMAGSPFPAFADKPAVGTQIDSSHPLANGLVGLWLFNENTGTQAADSTANNNTGTLVADTHWVTGNYNGPALDFDGTGDKVDLGTNGLSDLGDMTCVIWAYSRSFDHGNSNAALLSVGSNLDNIIIIRPTSESISINGAGIQGTSTPNNLGVWRQYVVTREGSTARYYHHANLIRAWEVGTDLISWAGAQIGLDIYSAYGWDGIIDHVMIYNRALSASEISTLYSNPFCMFEGAGDTQYIISASAGENGTIEPAGDLAVNEGADQAFTITPDLNYRIFNVSVDGVPVGPVATYTFTNVTQNGHTIAATFELISQPDIYEGFGAVTRGALEAPGGCEIYHVTSLADDGSPGTLRDAVSQGSRYIVFDVGGTITLTSSLNIFRSYITIDGSSAPSPGITIIQPQTIAMTSIEALGFAGPAHDIIIHNLRIDGQIPPDTNFGNGDILGIDGATHPVYNIIIDHVTAIASDDGVFDISGEVSNVTISWNIIMDTEVAQLIRGNVGVVQRISLHHNVYARNNERQIRMRHQNDIIDFVNNVIYGWGWMVCGPSGLDIDTNVGVPDDEYPRLNVENNVYHLVSGLPCDRGGNSAILRAIPGKIYFNGNILPAGESDNYDTSTRHLIPAYAEVTKYDASTLGDTVVPYVGTHYPTQEEQDLLNEISLAIGGKGTPDPLSWQPPIGIPRPEFGIEETHWMYEGQTYDFGSGPESYKDAGNGPYTHYVDNTHPDATDTDNPYGTASIPRNTIPEILAAGSVVEIHGGPYIEPLTLSISGTASNPVWIRGTDSENKVEIVPDTNSWALTFGRYSDCSYMILENMQFIGTNCPYRGAIRVYENSNHLVFRHLEIKDYPYDPALSNSNPGIAFGMSIGEWESGEVNQYHVVYDVDFKNYRMVWPPSVVNGGRHGHGIMCQDGVDNIWILDSNFSEIGEDGIHVIKYSGSTQDGASPDNKGPHDGNPNYIYIGNNEFSKCFENAIDVKASEHVIISQNKIHFIRDTDYSYGVYGGHGAAIVVNLIGWNNPGGNEAAKNVWTLYNEIYDIITGINDASSRSTYHIGNVIYDLLPTLSASQQRGSCFWVQKSYGSSPDNSVHIVGNTCYDFRHGVFMDYAWDFYAANNIWSELSDQSGYHILADIRGIEDIRNELFYDTTEVRISGFSGIDCIDNSDPLFVNAGNDEYAITADSPARDRGVSHNVYDIFYNLYGINIKKDFADNARPHGAGWDIGAYEYVASSPSPNQPPIANAGLDQTITDKDKDGSEEVTLDGSASQDPDGTIVSFIWSEGGLEIATGINPTVTLSTGTHLITLTVTDNGGLTDNDTVTIKVLEGNKGFGELPAGCYNNVFNPAKGERALIVVELSKQAHVRLNLYNTRGNKIRELADEEKEAGTYKYYWDGKSGNGDVVGSGLYFVHIQAGDYKKTKKIVVLK